MTPERHRQIGELYHLALERPVEHRAAFLDQACGSDEQLRRDVESLIVSHEQATSFLAQPALEVAEKLIAEDDSLLKTRRRVGHYEILSLLGAGGMGEVYLAQDARLGRRVALKLLPAAFTGDAERVRRFEQEARAASALNHPNIVTIHDIDTDERGRFIVMELVKGHTLRELLSQGLPPDAVVSLGGQMAKALSVAHAAGITHRDLKPENIMVREDRYVKVLDFGLALLTGSSEGESGRETVAGTTPGVMLGTVRYMSPEQARGERVSHASDVFSLGLIFYEMATGDHPFARDSVLDTLNAINSQAALPPSRFNHSLSTSLEQLVLRMLEKDPHLRPTAAAVVTALTEPDGGSGVEVGHSTAAPRPRRSVGRVKELEQLYANFTAAAARRGIVVGVAGEPGIGKTTLVEDFLRDLSASGQPCFIARGRCSERLAGTEAYLPWLEALESLLPKTEEATKRLAPSWYAQLTPAEGGGSSPGSLPVERASSQERLKRELRAMLHAVAGERPVVLFFDDLHWADLSTIDLLAFLADRLEDLRLLIVATYRPSDLLLAKHPFLQLKPDLQARGVFREIALDFLTRQDIERYLSLEFPDHQFPDDLLKLIHAKTEGSPLFVADLVRYLRHRGVIAQDATGWVLAGSLPGIERDLPESVRGMIERKINQLSEADHRLLSAASVQGYECDSAVLTQVLALDAVEVEERLQELEQVHAFVRLVEQREFPDRTLTLRYRFVHVLYQNALYASLRPTRRSQLSGAVAQSLEKFWGARRGVVANELAVLYEAAREFKRSAECFQLAAQNATQVFASQEAVQLARRGLAMVQMLPEGHERVELELSLQVVLGNTLIATRGYADPEVEQTYSRAHELCERLGETPHWLPVLCGLCVNLYTSGKHRKGLALAGEFLARAERQQEPAIVVAHRMVGNGLLFTAELTEARYHYERVVSIYTPAQHRGLTELYVAEPGMNGHVLLAWTLWLLGYPDLALRHSHEALALGRAITHPNSQAYALFYVAMQHQFRRERRRVRELAEELMTLASEQGLAQWLGHVMIQLGWTLAEDGKMIEGIEQMRRGLDAAWSTGAQMMRPLHLCWLAEAYGKAGQPANGLAALTEAQALIESNEERFCEAEVHRLRGELLSMEGASPSEVAPCFDRAGDAARRQQAKSFELRAAMSLSRLWRRHGEPAEGREILDGVYRWFSEGFDTADLKEAKTLLDK